MGVWGEMMVRQTQLKASVQRALESDPRLAGSDIRVAVARGVVRLTGRVATSAMKHAAGDVAHGVAGVLDVANNLGVADESSGIRMRVARHTAEDDASLAQAVRAALTDDAALRDLPAAVTLSHRRATLTGRMDDGEQGRALARRVGAVPGIVAVDTQVATRSVDDAIAAALATSGTVVDGGDGRVRFTLEGGTLRVEGSVSSWDERKAVLDAIARTGANCGVSDRLRVEPAG